MHKNIKLFIFFTCSSLQLFGTTPAVRLLNSVEYSYSLPSIIDENEWKELQLERLITSLDRTETSFGRWGLTYLLHPISNKNELMQRQKIISYLVEHADVLRYFQKALAEVKKFEGSLLAYWDAKDLLNNNCDQFYYSIPGFKNYLNKSSLALNLGVAIQMFDAGKGLLVNLCLGGVHNELWSWAVGQQENFSLLKGLKDGIKQPLKQHSFTLDVLKEREQEQYNFKDYVNTVLRGSFGDRYELFSKGFSIDATQLGLPALFSTPERMANRPAGFFTKGTAFLCASGFTAAYDYFWGVSLLSIGRYIKYMHASLSGLTERVINVSSCFDAMSHIIDASQRCEHIFGKYVYYDRSHQVAMDIMQDIVAKQSKHKQLYKYSRGHVLAMHKEIKEVKTALIPVFQTIALLDAFCSIAQLIKEHKSKQNKFCFVHFVDNDTPYITYKDAWLALLSHDKAVANDIYLGGDDHAGKVVVTGPNGGGKSTLLKTKGVAAVLAQGWAIVPASFAQQTIFYDIKTGLAPHEDLQQGLSTFMAEKKCMEYLENCIKKADKKHTVLMLIDEPYKGTVDDESAKRIYNFGMSIASNPYALVSIATHVKKPILLASDTNGIFANYHVVIKEESYGIFKRLFKLQQGPATWWFEDEDQRSRFVDWISTQLGSDSQLSDKQKMEILLHDHMRGR